MAVLVLGVPYRLGEDLNTEGSESSIQDELHGHGMPDYSLNMAPARLLIIPSLVHEAYDVSFKLPMEHDHGLPVHRGPEGFDPPLREEAGLPVHGDDLTGLDCRPAYQEDPILLRYLEVVCPTGKNASS